MIQKPHGYWTKERCHEEALKYNSRKDFHDNSSSAATKCMKNGWLDDVCLHMIEICKPKNYWTKERCYNEASKYNNRTNFQKNNTSAYISSRKNGWLNDICSHMVEKIKPDGYWSKEVCQRESLKYNSRSEFNKNSPKAYQQSWLNGWLNDICSHMQIIGDKYKRCIYVYEFSDDSAYIGLTFNIDKRHSNHITNTSSPVFKKIKENISYQRKILTDYINVEKSKKLESFYVDEYKKNNWIILNKAKTGGVGGKFIKWTKEKCQEEALKYNTRHELEKNNGSSYHVIIKNKWDNEMFSHMTRTQKPSGYWTKERCKEEALKYKTRKDFKKNSTAYTSSSKKGWLNEICSHML